MQSDKPRKEGETWREERQKKYFWDREVALPKKTFIIPCHRASPSADFPLHDLCDGRMDLASRVISSAMFFSSGVRRDVDAVLVLGDEYGLISSKGSRGAVVSEATPAHREANPDGPAPATAVVDDSAAGKKGRDDSRETQDRREEAGGSVEKREGAGKKNAKAATVCTVRVNGLTAKHLRPDERNIATMIQTAVWTHHGRVHALLKRRRQQQGGGGKGGRYAPKDAEEEELSQLGAEEAMEAMTLKYTNSLKGWSVFDHGFENALDATFAPDVSDTAQEPAPSRPSVIVQLDEEGEPFSSVFSRFPPAETNFVFVLGDHRGLCPQQEQILAQRGAVKVSVGPRPLLTSQCITLLLHYLDIELLGARPVVAERVPKADEAAA